MLLTRWITSFRLCRSFTFPGHFSTTIIKLVLLFFYPFLSYYSEIITNTILGYIGEFEYIDDHRSGKIVVQLNGRLNKCGVIQPRFNVKINDIERWTDNLLPARQFGYVILTTSAGIMDHEEARRKHVSGKILGFVY
ncbi:40S ribosomal protein S22 [Candida tropicalis MYA-3404]|uniref:40S ribosomal protein S22 n=1 Tax=Candida tropicalis (strain ATCC MYA-3404 / T1) TaxID=294747 RepID=C5MET1_CANTT|nr:40S ribosomal protein S22 [Candida tropicalis MYA-3404]EER31791.1 40S ribosomal protein S22 [Candida tropicalis MYA-3404]